MQRETGRPTSGELVRLGGAGDAAPRADRALPDTRARILKAAKEIFFRDGFADTNLDEVATRAEVGKGTLYRHFESKVELYVAVLAAGGASFEQVMAEEIGRAACRERAQVG